MKADIEKIAEEIEKFKKGDEESFEEIYKLSKETIEGYIVSFLKDKNYEEDVLQETYLQIYKNINQLKEPKAFFGWAGKIAVNISKRYIDKCKSENDKIELSKKRDFDVEYEKTNTELIVENKNKQEIVREALNSLTDIKKIIVTDYYFNNMKVDEIAESLEIASGTVKNHLFQARKTLDKKLKMFKESLDVLLLSWFTKEIENFAINKENENNNFTTIIKNLAQNESLKEPIINGVGFLANSFLSQAMSAIIPVTIAGGIITGLLIYNNKDENPNIIDTQTAYISETSTEKNEKEERELKEDKELFSELEESQNNNFDENNVHITKVVSDEELKEKYPNLIIDVGEISKVLDDEEVERNIENARNKLQEVYEGINNEEDLNEDKVNSYMGKIDEAFNICYDIHNTISVDDGLKFENNEKANEFDEIFFKGIYLAIKLTENNENARKSFFIDATDNIYISTAKRFNKYKGTYTFLYKYSEYITNELKDCFLKEEGFEKMSYASRLTGRIYKNNISGEEYTWANDNKKPSEVK